MVNPVALNCGSSSLNKILTLFMSKVYFWLCPGGNCFAILRSIGTTVEYCSLLSLVKFNPNRSGNEEVVCLHV